MVSFPVNTRWCLKLIRLLSWFAFIHRKLHERIHGIDPREIWSKGFENILKFKLWRRFVVISFSGIPTCHTQLMKLFVAKLSSCEISKFRWLRQLYQTVTLLECFSERDLRNPLFILTWTLNLLFSQTEWINVFDFSSFLACLPQES